MIVRKCRGLVFTCLAVAVSMVLGGRDLVAADVREKDMAAGYAVASGGRDLVAADVPSGGDQLTPIPANSDAASQPGASPFREEAPAGPVASADKGEGAEFCGLLVCSPPGRFWLRADYLIWWTSGLKLPPLVSTGPLGTGTILYGNSTVNDGGRSGVRTTLGLWLDACHVWDLEFDYLLLPEQSSSYTSPFSSGNPIIERPFFDVQTGAPSGEKVAYPNQVEGTVSVNARDYFQSAGVSLSYNLCSGNSCSAPCDSCGGACAGACGPPLLNCCRTDLLVGFRYYNLSDNVTINEDLTLIQDIRGVTGTRIQVRDSFSGRNDFYGSEIGLRTQIYRGRWSLEILTKIAIGNNHEVATIDGYTLKTPPGGGASTIFPHEGVFAVQSNEAVDANGNVAPGVYTRDVFTMIPQLGLELGRQMNSHWRAYVGYNVMYWGSVLRGGDQIDLNLDPRNFPPAQAGALPFPAFPGRTSSFWAHGVNVGTEFRF